MSPAELPVVVDRVEEGWAVLEVATADASVQWVEVPVSALPPGIAEGDSLRLVPAAWSSSGAGMPAVSGHGASARWGARPEKQGAARPEGEDR
jgi:hypothetical protein